MGVQPEWEGWCRLWSAVLKLAVEDFYSPSPRALAPSQNPKAVKKDAQEFLKGAVYEKDYQRVTCYLSGLRTQEEIARFIMKEKISIEQGDTHQRQLARSSKSKA